ncbi:CHASE3 domain-containing protein, partial [Candidatus Sumerlaeota bacterium]|nr:CHASE3 domain-containing protein [Candidatus Sumerlaeota bacterium]
MRPIARWFLVDGLKPHWDHDYMVWSVEKKIAAGFALALLVIVVVSAIAYRSMSRLIGTSRSVAHTHEVLLHTGHLTSRLREAEMEERSYVLTGDESYSKRCQAAAALVSEEIQRVRMLTKDDPDQQRRLDALEPLVAEKLAEVRETLELRKSKGLEAALQGIETDREKKVVADILALITEMESYENELLRQRDEAASASIRQSFIIFAIWVLVGLGLFGLVAYLVRQDLAAHRRAENALLESEEKLRSLIANIPDVTWTSDSSGNTTFISANVERVYGYTSEEVCKWGPEMRFGRIHPDDKDSVLKAYEALFSRNARFDVDYRVQRKDGTWIWVHDRAIATYEKAGVRYADGVFTDISEQKRHEEELRRAHEEMATHATEIEQRNLHLTLLAQMSELLQTCRSLDEAYAIVARSVRDLFPRESGALYVVNASRNLVEATAAWGDTPPAERVFAPEDCWALRRSQPTLVDDSSAGVVCAHVSRPLRAAYLCVPLVAQSETLGMLHLMGLPRGSSRSDATGSHTAASIQRLAVTVADQIALALSNLRLRDTLRSQSIRDPLTGLFNRRYMEETLEREVQRALRSGASVGIVMLDIDHFKSFNDRYGHEA